jgi:predicted SnoaL-like aldol condensation-catalyzing enzyme
MKKLFAFVGLLLAGLSTTAYAEDMPPTPLKDQLEMLKSDDPILARNKKIVFDFWRIVYEGGRMERAPDFMTKEYIQHNPNVKSGRDAFINTIGKARPPKPVVPYIKVPVFQIIAEKDIVMVAFKRKVRDRQNPDHIYFMTWYDVFRITPGGKITEHWDPSEMWVNGKPPGAEFFP